MVSFSSGHHAITSQVLIVSEYCTHLPVWTPARRITEIALWHWFASYISNIAQRYSDHENSPLPRISLNPSLQSLSDLQLVNTLGICKKESFIMQRVTLHMWEWTYANLFYCTSGQLLWVWPGVTIIFVNTKKEFCPYQKKKKKECLNVELISTKCMFVRQTNELKLRETTVFPLQWVSVKQIRYLGWDDIFRYVPNMNSLNGWIGQNVSFHLGADWADHWVLVLVSAPIPADISLKSIQIWSYPEQSRLHLISLRTWHA